MTSNAPVIQGTKNSWIDASKLIVVFCRKWSCSETLNVSTSQCR